MKGIILAGGSGTRLYPVTKSLSKQLIPVYDKPMIYYPLSLLMLANLKEIAIITTPQDIESYKKLLGDGTQWGIKLEFIIQERPEGLAQAFILAESFLNGSDACLILGDNIFYGHGLTQLLTTARINIEQERGACVFAYKVANPERYGVADFDKRGKVISLEEKPLNPKSNYAVTGLYFYDNNVCDFAKTITPSARGELEITDLNRLYLDRNALRVELMDRGFAWLDTGTHESLIEASQFVAAVEHRQGLKIACVEEIAYQKGWIDDQQLMELAKPLEKNAYGRYLRNLIGTV